MKKNELYQLQPSCKSLHGTSNQDYSFDDTYTNMQKNEALTSEKTIKVSKSLRQNITLIMIVGILIIMTTVVSMIFYQMKENTKITDKKIGEAFVALTLENRSLVSVIDDIFNSLREVESKTQLINESVLSIKEKNQERLTYLNSKVFLVSNSLMDVKEDNQKRLTDLHSMVSVVNNSLVHAKEDNRKRLSDLHSKVSLVNNSLIDLRALVVRTHPPVDCWDAIRKNVGIKDGIYILLPTRSTDPTQVYCDMTTDGGGWTVFQRRFNGSVQFYRNFQDYENGFGSLEGEFWLGLKYVYQMTRGVDTDLRLDLEDAAGNKAFQVYRNFSLGSRPSYTLSIGSSNGTAGDSGKGMSYNNDLSFSTLDQGNTGCANKDRGGWWFGDCTYANLNGEYVTPGTQRASRAEGGVTYRAWKGFASLRSTEMKFRRR